MKRQRATPARTRSPLAALAALVAVAAAILLPSVARADCGPIASVDDVSVGDTGTGWTVAQGRTRVPFDVEILGVARDGLGPGRDLVIVEASSPELDRAGGIWAGMSGSPVYVGGELLGAVSYGFSFGPSMIGGVTPAEDMVNLLGLPSITAGLHPEEPRTVRLDRGLAHTVARAAGVPVADASVFARLRMPLSISGLNANALKALQANFASRMPDASIPYLAGAAPRTTAIGDPPEPGDSFAAAISYGAVTSAAVGTATYVCNGQVLAFGHPFLHGGPTALGASAADAFTVVPEPTFGPYKLAQVAEPLGVVDQDRLAGIRTTLGATPTTFPIEVQVDVPETGVTKTVQTDVVLNDQAGYLTFATALSAIGTAFDAVGSGFDSAGRGTARVWFRFEGTRADGTPWVLERGNRWASRTQISVNAAFGPAIWLDGIVWLPPEQITITRAKLYVSIEKAVRRYRIARVLVAKGSGPFTAARAVKAAPRQRIRVRLVMNQFEGPPKTVDFAFRLPKRLLRNAVIGIHSRVASYEELCGAGGWCWVPEELYDVESLDELLTRLNRVGRNDEVDISLSQGRKRYQLSRARLDGVVEGGDAIRVNR
jgi:hypothetical protein